MPEPGVNDVSLAGPGAGGSPAPAPPRTSDGPGTPILDATGIKRSLRTSVGMPHVNGNFRPERKLGEGSFGEVWLAEEWVNERLLRKVAIKFLHGDALGRGAVAELLDEVEKLGEVGHDRGVIGVHHVETTSDPPYFTMDYAPGGSLGQRLRSQGRMSPQEALPILRHVAEALRTLHSKGIIHCDLKPDNILLSEDGRPLVADFGQARFKGRGRPNPGTWYYMAPEQMSASGSHTETATDIYALGAIFYEMVVGEPPRFNTNHNEIIARKISTEEVFEAYRQAIVNAPDPMTHIRLDELDIPLRTIVDKCLQIDPEKRFGDGAALIAALDLRERWLAWRPVLNRTLMMTVAILVAMLVMLAAVLPMLMREFRTTYLQESLHRDFNTARLAGDFVQDSIDDSLTLAQNWAQAPVIVEAYQKRDCQMLETLLFDFVFAQSRNTGPDCSNSAIRAAAIYDHEGVCLAQVLVENDKLLRTRGLSNDVTSVVWSWRDWFNGMGNDQPPLVTPYPPVSRPSISSPYRGLVPDGSKSEVRVSFSAPLDLPGDENHLKRGVLVLAARPESMFRWSRDPQLLKNGLVAVVDRDTHLIIHGSIVESDRRELIPLGEEKFPTKCEDGAIEMREPPDHLKRYIVKTHDEYKPLVENAKREESQIEQLDDFVDPVNRQHYLVSFCYLPRSGWGVMVQHELHAALELFLRFETYIYLIGWFSYLAGVGLLTWLWSMILRRRHREARFLNG